MSISENFQIKQTLTCPAGSTSYTIQAGDTFYTIAQRLGTTVAAITALNPGINPAALQVGQQICVPGVGPGPGTCPGGTIYTIRPGDTFYAVAVRYGISVSALLAANPGIDPNRLMVGMRICIPGTETPPTVTLIPTPFCSLLRPVLAALPPVADIPIGSVTVRQVAMSTRAYTITVAPLPDPATLGNYNGYVGVLSLITDYPPPTPPRDTVIVRLIASNYGNQLTTWAGTTITTWPPIVGDFGEIRPVNTNTGARGPALLRGDLAPCGKTIQGKG